MELRSKSLLGRPVGQLSIVKGYAYACRDIRDREGSVDKDLLVKKLDSMNWSIQSSAWKGLLVKPNGRIMYGKRASNMASKLIAHRIGAVLTKTDTEKIQTFIHGNKGLNKRLPARVVLR